MALLTAAAALIGNARRVSPWNGWTEPAILWSCVVGDPSSGKSPALDPVAAAIRDLEKELAVGFDNVLLKHETAKQTARALRESWQSQVRDAVKKELPPPDMPAGAADPAEPVRPRIITADTTIERLGSLSAAHEKGLLYFRDELAGWFGAFDRYGGSGSDRAIWLEAYGGRFYVIDRVKYPDPIKIEHFSVGILGGVQPDRLSEMLAGADDGLVPRFLWTWPNKLPPIVPAASASHQFAVDALRRLLELRLVPTADGDRPFVCMIEAEAKDIFQNFRLADARADEFASGLLKGSIGKAAGHVLRLSLVLEHLWWAGLRKPNGPPCSIGRGAMEAAVHLMIKYFRPMAERVFGDAAVPEGERNASTLARWIFSRQPQPVIINARELLRAVKLPGLRDKAKLDPALDQLVEAGWLLSAPERAGGSNGRSRRDYRVNPQIWAQRQAA